MSSQNFSVEVSGAGALLSHQTTWRPEEDAPECSIEMPADCLISVVTASVGKVVVSGDLVLDPASGNGRSVFRWSSTAREVGHGSGSVSFSHPSDEFNDIEISVDMSEEASLSVEDHEVHRPVPLTSNDTINRYGAYIVGFLGALGALVFAYLMPSHREELMTAAGAIGFWSYLATDAYDRFVVRILGFLGAAGVMVAAMFMPDNADTLIGVAGLLCIGAIIWGDE